MYYRAGRFDSAVLVDIDAMVGRIT